MYINLYLKQKNQVIPSQSQESQCNVYQGAIKRFLSYRVYNISIFISYRPRFPYPLTLYPLCIKAKIPRIVNGDVEITLPRRPRDKDIPRNSYGIQNHYRSVAGVVPGILDLFVFQLQLYCLLFTSQNRFLYLYQKLCKRKCI